MTFESVLTVIGFLADMLKRWASGGDSRQIQVDLEEAIKLLEEAVSGLRARLSENDAEANAIVREKP